MNKLRIAFLLGLALVFSSFAFAMDNSHHPRHHHHKHKKHRRVNDRDERRI